MQKRKPRLMGLRPGRGVGRRAGGGAQAIRSEALAFDTLALQLAGAADGLGGLAGAAL